MSASPPSRASTRGSCWRPGSGDEAVHHNRTGGCKQRHDPNSGRKAGRYGVERWKDGRTCPVANAAFAVRHAGFGQGGRPAHQHGGTPGRLRRNRARARRRLPTAVRGFRDRTPAMHRALAARPRREPGRRRRHSGHARAHHQPAGRVGAATPACERLSADAQRTGTTARSPSPPLEAARNRPGGSTSTVS